MTPPTFTRSNSAAALGVDLLECDDRLHARVVDDEVEAAEGVDRGPADRGRVSLDVAGDDRGAVAELRGESLGGVGPCIRMHEDGRAGLVEPPRDTTTDRSAGTRDDGDATGEIEQSVDRRGSHHARHHLASRLPACTTSPPP